MEKSLESLQTSAKNIFEAWLLITENTPINNADAVREYLNLCMWKVENRIKKDRQKNNLSGGSQQPSGLTAKEYKG